MAKKEGFSDEQIAQTLGFKKTLGRSNPLRYQLLAKLESSAAKVYARSS